jgi:hypothetical protein
MGYDDADTSQPLFDWTPDYSANVRNFPKFLSFGQVCYMRSQFEPEM